jgi:hypothetical protein
MWYEMRRRQHRVYWRTEQWKGKTAELRTSALQGLRR